LKVAAVKNLLKRWSQVGSRGFWLSAFAMVALACLAFVVDEVAFHHPYAVTVEYPGQGVQAVQVNFEGKRGLLGQEVLNNRSGSVDAVVARASFKSRRPVVSVQVALMDAAGQAITQGQFHRVVVKTRWGEAVPVSVTESVVTVKPLQGTWDQALKRNGVKWALVLVLTVVFVGVIQTHQQAQKHRWPLIALFSWVILLTLMAGEVVSDRTIYGDGVGQLRATYNLFTHNVFAEQLGSPPAPDNFIEPLPAFVNSLYFHVLSWTGIGPLAFDDLHWGGLVYLAKQINLLWVFVGQLALAVFVYVKTQKLWVTATVVLLAHVFFFGSYRVVDTYYTELQGGVLLLLSSMALHQLFEQWGWRSALLSGVLLALLALTKASFYYINLVVILVVAGALLLGALWHQRITVKRAAALALVVVLSYAAVLGPWMARNHAHFGSAAVSDRGGVVLYIRATKNQMTAEEIRGAFYLYGPSIYHHFGNAWAYARPTSNELDPQVGAWMRVNRNRSPNSFFATVRNELSQAMAATDAQGRPMTLNQVAAEMNRKAISSILENPVKHVGMSFVFLWRGMWGVAPVDFYGVKSHRDLIVTELAMLAFYLLAALFVLRALVKRDIPTLMLGLLTVGGVAFYAGLSHFLPRYMVQFYPVIVLMASLQLFALLRRKSA
jgi:hypothetical protein